MSAIKLSNKDVSFLDIQTEQTLGRIEKGLEKNFEKVAQNYEKTNKKIDILYYFLFADIALGFLILGTMRNWF